MIRNNKGFSIIELFAIILITTTIIVPMITALAGNFEVNTRYHFRRSANNISENALTGLDIMTYSNLQQRVATANTNNNYYVELDADTCTVFSTTTEPYEHALCNEIFALSWNDLTLDAASYKIYLYSYYLTDTMQTALTTNENIPTEVQDEIALLSPSTVTTNSLIRATIWIEYYEEENSILTISGVIYDD